MAVKTAQQALDNYVAAMQDAKTAKAYRDGINATTVNPMALAASDQAMQDYSAGVQRSISTGHRARRLLAANPAVWKANAVGIGANNLGSGAQKAKAKLAPILTQLQQVWVQQNALKTSMPGADRGAGKARMNAAFDLMASFKDSQL